MILLSVNNVVELFFLTKSDNLSIKKIINKRKVILVVPCHIANQCRAYLPNGSQIITFPNLYLSKNPFKMIGMLYGYIHTIKKLDKSKIHEVITVGEVTANSLILQHVLKSTDITVFSMQEETTPENLKTSIFDTLSLSLAYLIFIRKIAVVRTLKTFASVKIYPAPAKAQSFDYTTKEISYSRPINQIIVIGERLYPDQSSFSAEEENKYLRLLYNLAEQANTNVQNIDLSYFPRRGFTERYHAQLESFGFKVINTDKSFESYILDMPIKFFGTTILAVKSTCLVSSKLLNLRCFQIGDLIQLELCNKVNIDNFYKGFRNLNLPQLNSISQLF